MTNKVTVNNGPIQTQFGNIGCGDLFQSTEFSTNHTFMKTEAGGLDRKGKAVDLNTGTVFPIFVGAKVILRKSVTITSAA